MSLTMGYLPKKALYIKCNGFDRYLIIFNVYGHLAQRGVKNFRILTDKMPIKLIEN